MTTPLPHSLLRFGEQLERSIERDLAAGARRRRRIAIRLSAATAAGAAIAAGVVSLPVADTTIAPPGGHLATASAAERAAAVLSPPGRSIVHTVASYRAVAPDGTLSTWREETWRQTVRPYARREVTTRGGVRIETASVGDRPAALYDARTNTVYTNPPAGGPALGTPMPARDGDPLAAEMAQLLRSSDPRSVSRSGGAIRFASDNRWPDGEVVRWTYVVDAKTFRPLRLTTASPGGTRVTTRFATYETLGATARTDALLDLRAQHPGASVDRSAAAYAAAQARLDGQP
jgi:hypothetical protein